MRLHVVLVRSEYAKNVGACARAMANMGAERLILIDPRCELDIEARQGAAGAQRVLADAIIYPDWKAFFAAEGDGLRIGLTRRGGKKRKVDPLEDWVQTPVTTENLYLIFGPEADGLDAEDLAFVNHACHLPVFGEFASYNLAQAVLLTLYILRQKFPPDALLNQTTGQARPAVQPFYFPDELIKRWLEAMGFDVEARRASAYLTLRRLFLQNEPTRHEIQVLEAILQQNIRKLKASTSCETAD